MSRGRFLCYRAAMQASSLYLHIPFCSRKCAYCDFAVRVLQHEQQVSRYVEHLALELAAMAPFASSLNTLYIGGGTPSVLTVPHIEALQRLLEQFFDLSHLQEWTLEVNPEHAEPAALAAWKNAGVNRISLGVQSFDNTLLQRCGRLHDREHIFEAVSRIQAAGFNNWSLDLMYALPEQTLEQWKDTLTQAIALAPAHISLYALEVHPRTLFGVQDIAAFSEDLAGDMYELACDSLQAAGFVHYEIANFCQPHSASQHNQVYWQTQPFVAVGVGAHGYVQGKRYENPADLGAYYRQCRTGAWPVLHTSAQPLAEAIEEFMFLGLRQLERGVFFADFEQRFQRTIKACYGDRIVNLLQQGLLQQTPQGLRLSPQAVGLSNRVLAEFLEPLL